MEQWVFEALENDTLDDELIRKGNTLSVLQLVDLCNVLYHAITQNDGTLDKSDQIQNVIDNLFTDTDTYGDCIWCGDNEAKNRYDLEGNPTLCMECYLSAIEFD